MKLRKQNYRVPEWNSIMFSVWIIHWRVVLFEAVDGCICFTRKIQHGGDWERSRRKGPKNVHNFIMTVRPQSWACGHGTEMFLILKNIKFWPDYSPIFSDMTVQRNVPRFCTRSICGWNLFKLLGLDYLNLFSAEIDIRLQNLTSKVDPRDESAGCPKRRRRSMSDDRGGSRIEKGVRSECLRHANILQWSTKQWF